MKGLLDRGFVAHAKPKAVIAQNIRMKEFKGIQVKETVLPNGPELIQPLPSSHSWTYRLHSNP